MKMIWHAAEGEYLYQQFSWWFQYCARFDLAHLRVASLHIGGGIAVVEFKKAVDAAVIILCVEKDSTFFYAAIIYMVYMILYKCWFLHTMK